jgi:hypothetical protein
MAIKLFFVEKMHLTGTKSLLMFLLITQISCNKLVEVDSPVTSLTSDNVYTNDVTASSVFIGLYAALGTNSPLRAFSVNSISLISALSADELTLFGGSANYNTALVQYYLNKLTPGNATTQSQVIWNDFFTKIYTLNIALEKLTASDNLTTTVRRQLIGEAKFMRAFFYFYLVNLYGDVPLIITSDYRINSSLPRTPKAQVYEQLIKDLQEAQELLSGTYVGADAINFTAERTRPVKWAAAALLARAYLYTGDWKNAEEQASTVISNKALYDTVSLNNVFLKNSKEAIWQLQPVNTGWNTEDARVFVLPPTGPTSSMSDEGYPVIISKDLLTAFESGDKRRSNWLGNVVVSSGTGNETYYFPYKYKSASLNSPVTEYVMVLRLGEQYLIRAEARAQQNNLSNAKDDLNLIRARAGLGGFTGSDKETILSAILHERQIELFSEWGHRWLDMKRTANVNAIMTAAAPIKGTTWNSNWQLYPIPLYDITINPNLEQNQGY